MADFLREAVGAKLSAAAGRELDDSTMNHLDLMSFLNPDGDIDQEKIENYAGVLGGRSQASSFTAPLDPVAQALSAIHSPRGTGGGSVSQLRSQERARLKEGSR